MPGGEETDAAVAALNLVTAVRDDPARRLRLASTFYDDRPGRDSIRAYRRAEMAFMRWQFSRGLLEPASSGTPGSPWWRSVNESLLRDAWEADLLLRGMPGQASTPAVWHWVDFLRRPSAGSWYRAHNASVVAGYIASRHLCAGEAPVERFFMDVALGRVLFAHALVVRPRLALGRSHAVGRLLGDPRWRAADLFLSLRNILPDRYPLTDVSIGEILSAEHYLGRLIDYGVLLPRIRSLYAFAAADLGEPRLLGFLQDGYPVYAWSYADSAAWTTTRSRRVRSLLSWLTSVTG